MLAVLGTGCSGSHASWRKPGEAPVAAAKAAVTQPAADAADVPTATEITVSGEEAAAAQVSLTADDGSPVPIARRTDGSTWVAAKQLKYATKYTVKVTAPGSHGKPATSTSSFTTMARPATLVRISSQVGDNLAYGVGMPLVVIFSADVAKDQRSSVERRLFVWSDPPQEGSWNWFNAHEIHFRPKDYWRPGTKLRFRLATGGLSLGGDRYGAADVNVHASIGPKVVMTVDNATKSMTVAQDGQVLRTVPVSLGKPASPSSSGNMVIMVKNEWEWFDSSTYGVPADSPDGYRTKVLYTQRLTWGGQYIHAAPWSVADQGVRNVSHGCTNISLENAQWLFQLTHLGDPVIVKGTERPLTWGDGWTDWNVDWLGYLKGSALDKPAAAPPPPA